MAQRRDDIDGIEPSRAPRTAYDWARWCDGAVWELAEGVDFYNWDSFRKSAYQAALARGKAMRIKKVGDRVLIQAQSRQEEVGQ